MAAATSGDWATTNQVHDAARRAVVTPLCRSKVADGLKAVELNKSQC
jgi:hypothetical protein